MFPISFKVFGVVLGRGYGVPFLLVLSTSLNSLFWGRDNLDFAETNSSSEDDFINAGWVLLKEQEVAGNETGMSSIIIPNSSSQKRFIRIRTISTVNNEGVKYTELTFYGENIQPVDLDKSEFDLVNLPSDNPGTFYGAEPENYLFDNNSFSIV